jgi:hypothetical protein
MGGKLIGLYHTGTDFSMLIIADDLRLMHLLLYRKPAEKNRQPPAASAAPEPSENIISDPPSAAARPVTFGKQ